MMLYGGLCPKLSIIWTNNYDVACGLVAELKLFFLILELCVSVRSDIQAGQSYLHSGNSGPHQA